MYGKKPVRIALATIALSISVCSRAKRVAIQGMRRSQLNGFGLTLAASIKIAAPRSPSPLNPCGNGRIKFANALYCVLEGRKVFQGRWWIRGRAVRLSKERMVRKRWTLQELLAPQCVIFVTHNWEVIGHKSSDSHRCTIAPNLLNGIITEVTGISQDVLCGFESRRKVISKETKMVWAANRRTTKVEDVAYCK